MEWKADEIWMYTTARQIADGTAPWPWLGMTSSTGLQNPGLSVWCFAVLAWVSDTPVAMVRLVQILNIVALGALFGWLQRVLPSDHPERMSWLGGVMLMGVSPLAILFSRKLWTIDLLPVFGFPLLVGHWYRQRRWGSAVWGFVGALIGQLHMSGFFLATGLVLWTLYADGRRRTLGMTHWLYWAMGTALGLVPLLPWVSYLLGAERDPSRSWVGVVFPKFFVHWFPSSMGINLGYSLGPHFWHDFMPFPVVAGVPTYLMAALHGVLLVLGLVGLGHWGRQIWPLTTTAMATKTGPLGFYLRAGGLVTGLLFTLFALDVPVHYVAIAFPYVYLWQAGLWAHRPRLLVLVAVVQLLVAVGFLWFIHITGGFADADYGVVYRLQG